MTVLRRHHAAKSLSLAEIRPVNACVPNEESGGVLCVCQEAKSRAIPAIDVLQNVASQTRTAFASMVANTGCRSPGELLMT